MKIARLLLLAGLVSVPAGSSALAQQPVSQAAPTPQAAAAVPAIPPDQQATREQIQKLFEVAHLRQQMQQVLNMMPAAFQQGFQSQMKAINSKLAPGNEMSVADQAAFEKTMNKYMEKVMSVYPVDEMVEDAIPVYQRHLSRQDADAIITFYSSPVGQRMLDQQPAIMSEYMAIVTNNMQQRIGRLTDEMMAELRQLGLGNSFPSGSAPAPSK